LVDITFSVELGNWVKTKDGVTNRLRLKKKGTGKEKDIKLGIEHGKTDVTINSKAVPGANKLEVLAAEIVRFFSEE
jgi:hypothetical protein